MDNEYAVMLTGTLVTGRAPTEVKQTLAGLFSISLEEIDSLLSKAPVRIKQNVDQDTARRYKVAVEKAGALCDVVEPLMDLEDTIPPGAAPGLQEALASTVRASDQDSPDTSESAQAYRHTLSRARLVGAGRGVSWLADGFRSFGQNPLQWLGIFVVGTLVTILSVGILYPMLLGGLMLGLERQENGAGLKFRDLFDGFRENGAKLVLVGLVAVGLYIVITTTTAIIGGAYGFASVLMITQIDQFAQITVATVGTLFLLVLLSLIGTLVVTLPVWFAAPLIVFHDLSLVDALKLSFLGCVRNWFAFLVVYGSLSSLLLLAGLITFTLAYCVIVPVFVASVYFSYRDIYTD